MIGSNVTFIGEDAFYDCYSLTSVYITDIASWCRIEFSNSQANPLYTLNGSYPDNVVNPFINVNLYLNNQLVTKLVIPDSVTSIGDYAFHGRTSLTSVIIGDSVTSIGNYAFNRCNNLSYVVISNNVTYIGDYAFYDCYSLTSVVIPDSVTFIGKGAFEDCKYLRNVFYTGSEEEWTKISISSRNEYLTNATIHYNYVLPE